MKHINPNYQNRVPIIAIRMNIELRVKSGELRVERKIAKQKPHLNPFSNLQFQSSNIAALIGGHSPPTNS